MIKISNIESYGWDVAIRGMRNPLNSWQLSDSSIQEDGTPVIGPKDWNLMTRLRNAGTDHRKYMRMIMVSMDITAPLYWWKEFDTYKVGTVANSCSTMHKIHAKEFTVEDFSHDHFDAPALHTLARVISYLNQERERFLDKESENPKEHWWHMIQLLPSSYNQKRTILLNYEVLANIYKSRKNHKLDEWRTFCTVIPFSLPYGELITGDFGKDE